MTLSLNLIVFLDFKQLWRAVSVEGLSERDIEEYHKRYGIKAMSADRKIFVSRLELRAPHPLSLEPKTFLLSKFK